MQFLVEFEVFEGITHGEPVARLREAMGPSFKRISESDKVKHFAIWGDSRGGMLILEMNASIEAYELLGSAIFDSCRVKVRPLVAPGDIMKFFESGA